MFSTLLGPTRVDPRAAEVDLEGDAPSLVERGGVAEPAPGEAASLVVGEDAQAALRCPKAGASRELGVPAERGVAADVVRRGLFSTARREELGDAPVHQLAPGLRDPEVNRLLHELVRKT